MRSTTLRELIDELLAAEFAASPVMASGLGLTDYDDRLDDLSAQALERRDADAARFLGRFEELDERLEPDEEIDRELAMAILRGRVILTEWTAWRRDPLIYSTPVTNGIFNLFLHRLRPDAELVDAAVARLAEVPRALEQGRVNLDPGLASTIVVERGLGAARGAVRYLRELVALEVAAGPLRDRLAEAGARAAVAMESWAAFLEDILGRASGDWRLGEERYTRLLREREALDDDARSLRDRGQAEFDRLDAEMRDLARRIDGSDDYAGLLERSNRDHPPTEEAMRAAYEDWTGRARSFLEETGLVTLPPGERCAVVPSPVFMRPVLGVAFYISPPAFSERLLGHFFVPFAPDGTPPAEVRKRLEGNAYGDIPTVSVHEAYPGHHWHLVMRKSNPARIRQVFATPYLSEGWALYAERMVRERGFFTEPLHELYHLNATIFRAARIIVDTSLHLGEMSFEEAVRFMVEKAALPEPTARSEVGRYCWWPTQASAYLTGCLEILRMRDEFLAARGLGGTPPAEAPVEVLREFHDTLTSSGSLPLGLARRAVLGRVAAGRA